VSDGITFERLGVPAAVICTDKFIVSGEAMAEAIGMPGYPFAAPPHPIAILTPDEANAWADGVAKQVEALLRDGHL
jgi:hypothetical protein